MVITTDDFVKILLVLAVAFSIVGITIQVIRILGKLVDTVSESNTILALVHDFLERFMEDYDFIIEQVKYILEALSGFSRSVFTPLGKIFGFLRKFEDISDKFGGKGKDSKE